MKIDCIVAGVGGQGTVLASKLIAQAAQNRGLYARTAETIGMAQRGGCVVSHVRIGSDIHSPIIPKRGADLIIGFEPAEAVRCLPYLKKGGTVVVSTKAIKPVTSSLSETAYDGGQMLAILREKAARVIEVDGEAIPLRCGSSKVLNVALLGAASASGALGLRPDELEAAIRERVAERFIAMNTEALALGAEAAGSQD